MRTTGCVGTLPGTSRCIVWSSAEANVLLVVNVSSASHTESLLSKLTKMVPRARSSRLPEIAASAVMRSAPYWLRWASRRNWRCPCAARTEMSACRDASSGHSKSAFHVAGVGAAPKKTLLEMPARRSTPKPSCDDLFVSTAGGMEKSASRKSSMASSQTACCHMS